MKTFQSEDTIAAITSFACMCFGMYPEYQVMIKNMIPLKHYPHDFSQEKAYEEIISVTANKQDGLSISDLGQLQYLDMCLKETLRVAPIAPFIVREPFENFEIGIHPALKIPKYQNICFRWTDNPTWVWRLPLNIGSAL